VGKVVNDEEMRSIEELTSAESSWPSVLDLLASTELTSEVVSAPPRENEDTLFNLQVSVRSVLGALAWNCGLVAIDHGWVRVLGAGFGTVAGLHVEKLRDVTAGQEFEGIVAAQDVLGGLFVIHGAGFNADAGEILYWAPDTLDWNPCGMGHADLVAFLVSDRLASFYADLRWDGWETVVGQVPYDQGVAAYPYPWTAEGKRPGVARRAVPMSEVVEFGFDAAEQLSR
jgi:hypothetical protein